MTANEKRQNTIGQNQWLKSVDNLLTALIIYRQEEEKAVNRIKTILDSYGIKVTEEEIRSAEPGQLQEKVENERTYLEQGDEQNEKVAEEKNYYR